MHIVLSEPKKVKLILFKTHITFFNNAISVFVYENYTGKRHLDVMDKCCYLPSFCLDAIPAGWPMLTIEASPFLR